MTNAVGTVTSNEVTLTVNPLPAITTQPSSTTVNQGSQASFSVVATNAVSYQWQMNNGTGWVNFVAGTGSTSASLTTAPASAVANGFKFRVAVTNAVGTVTSNEVTLTVNPLPAITTQPSNTTVNEGAMASFSVVATNAVSYQWQMNNGTGLSLIHI